MSEALDLDRFHTFWRRFWAGWIDALIFYPQSWINKWVWGHFSSPWALVPWFVFACLSYALYSILLHGFFGQTIGKRVMGVKVLDRAGARLSMKQAVLRDSFYVVYTMVSLAIDLPAVASGRNPYDPETASLATLGLARILSLSATMLWSFIEVVTMLTNEKRRALHDFIAGTVVVRTGPRTTATAPGEGLNS
jgi:uncharacterized RDD family membrane protein YckC